MREEGESSFLDYIIYLSEAATLCWTDPLGIVVINLDVIESVCGISLKRICFHVISYRGTQSIPNVLFPHKIALVFTCRVRMTLACKELWDRWKKQVEITFFEAIEDNVKRQMLCARIADKWKVSPISVSRVYSDACIAFALAILQDFWHLSLLSNLAAPSTTFTSETRLC